MENGTILIVDDNKSVLASLELLLENEFGTVRTAANPNQITTLLTTTSIDVVILDMNFSAGINNGNEGLYWLKQIHEIRPSLPVVMLTAYGDVELAVKALKNGATDFLLKPWDNQILIRKIKEAYKSNNSKAKSASKTTGKQGDTEKPSKPEMLIGHSPAMLQLIKVVTKVAKTDANILITGENGTGKEMLAKEIHRLSPRNSRQMLGIDMGAISESLFESELFGHERGAFTDAYESRPGKFEAANGSSLFMDEIGNLSIALQAKLLTVLQNRNVTRIGSNKVIPVDIRLISATNKDIPEMVKQGLFREDLFYRINTIHLEIPPLRDYPLYTSIYYFFYLCLMLLETDQIRDPRLLRRLNLICSQMVVHQSAIVNQFSKEHKEKMGAYRFLNNSSVSSDAILSGLIQTCCKNASGRKHLLCIQDTSEINYEAHVERMKKKTASPGIVGQKQCGTFLHPVLVVDASSHIPIGFSSVKQWNRSPAALSREERNYRYQPIEEKESYRWIESGMAASEQMPRDAVKTIIGDREADIFELFSRIPTDNVHLLIRSVHERNCRLDDPDCSVHLNTLMEQAVLRAEYSFEVLPGSGRKKRVACMELRFERVTLCAPVNGPAKGSPPVSLYCIHVKEKSSSTPVNESPIEWRLLTTHVVETVEQAIECIGWYRCRWLIEELFRVLKRKGFMIEDAQLETVSALQKLILISLQAALQVMVLKLSFDKEDEKLSSEIYFTSKEIALLHIVGKKSEGNTKIQQNPYKKESMAWAAWIIARLGAWSAYKSQSIPGYITFKNGLDRFYTQFELYELIS